MIENSHFDASSRSSDSPVSTTWPVKPSPTRVRKTSAVGRSDDGDLALERDRLQHVALAEEDAAVVVVDQQPELVRDRHPDRADLGEPVQLPAQRLQHLQVGDRAHVLTAGVSRLGPLGRRLVEEHDLVLAARLRGHHRRLGARDQLARVRRVLGPVGDPDRDRDLAGHVELDLLEPRRQPVRHRHRVGCVAGGDDDGELLAADPADDVRRAHRGAQVVRQARQHLVAGAVAVDVVDLLEVVDVDHHERHRLVDGRAARQLAPQPLVEVAVVVEPRERVGLGLVLELRAPVCVVERERGRIAEALRQLELLLAEGRVLADPVDVERSLQQAARDERDDDQRLRVDRSAGNELHAGVEVRLVREHGLAVLHSPARDSLAERESLAEDLARPFAADERGHQLALGLVGLVDVQRLVGDDLCQRVGDPHEQRVEALLRQHVVEDIREPPVGVDVDAGRGRRVRRRSGCDQPEARPCAMDGGAGWIVHGARRQGVVGTRPRRAGSTIGLCHVVAVPRTGERLR